MKSKISIQKYDSPIIVTAIHDGHTIPPSILGNINLEEHERMREEDPYTAYIADLPVNKIIVENSRFLTDLNRPKDKCIYKEPEDAWGLQVWKTPISAQVETELLAYYDYFYQQVHNLVNAIIEKHSSFVVLDLHSYNHKRKGPNLKANAKGNPEINIGTIHNSQKWRPLINSFLAYLSETTVKGHTPDVRENVKFQGGEFSRWICKHFGDRGCVLSVEFKKTFMDEWTGRVDISQINDLREAIRSCIPLLKNELKRVNQSSSTL